LIKKYKECKDLEVVMEFKKQLDDAEKIVKSKIEPVVIEASIPSAPVEEVKEGYMSKTITVSGTTKSMEEFMTVLAKYCFAHKLDINIL
jgi:hypothetical protein